MDVRQTRALLNKIYIVKDHADLENILQNLKSSSSTRPVRIGFINAHAFNLAYKSKEFYQDLIDCDYLFRDGIGMKVLYGLLSMNAGMNMNGTDFIPRILDSYKGSDIALIGTQDTYLKKAATKISEMGLNPVLKIDGYQSDDLYSSALKQINAPIIVLAMGMPKQERVARLISRDGIPRLIICGGAILDFIGGKVSRAPDFFRRYGMEWLYRLAQEPKRLFGRYVIGNTIFLLRAVSFAWAKERSDKLKILHVVRQYSPSIGGLESYVESMVRHQKNAGYECNVLTLNKVFHSDGKSLPDEELIEGIPIKRISFLGKRRFFIPLISPFFYRKFDIIHVHSTDMFYDYVGLLAALRFAPAFATTHGGFFHTQDFSLIKKIYFNTITRFSSLSYKALFANSQNDINIFKQLRKNIILLPNAVEPIGSFLTEGKDFIYIGRLAQHKNIDRVIRIFANLKKDHGMDRNLHIVGPEWDVSIISLQDITRQSGVEDSVIFHGSVPKEGMASIALKCGYFISASSYEGFGMSLVEAMSVGIIPVVHANDSFHELLSQSGVGLCMDFMDEKEAANMISLMPKPDIETKKQAQNFALLFSWPELVKTTSSIYKDNL